MQEAAMKWIQKASSANACTRVVDTTSQAKASEIPKATQCRKYTTKHGDYVQNLPLFVRHTIQLFCRIPCEWVGVCVFYAFVLHFN